MGPGSPNYVDEGLESEDQMLSRRLLTLYNHNNHNNIIVIIISSYPAGDGKSEGLRAAHSPVSKPKTKLINSDTFLTNLGCYECSKKITWHCLNTVPQGPIRPL